MPFRDLREHLTLLEEKGLLRRIKSEVDKDWELGCIMRAVIRQPREDKRYAIWFERIKGSDFSVVVGVLGANRDVYASALGVPKEDILDRWANSLANPMEPRSVNSGPIKENIIRADKQELDLMKLPIPIWTPGKDPAPYIGGAFLVMKDPETGKRNVGTYRMMLKGKDKTGILIVPSQHSGVIYSKYEKMGKPMPVAVCIGAVPSVGMASVAKIPYSLDEFGVAGALNGSPIDLIKCETVDLEVPATAEIVIEGEVLPKVREMEGPFGEYTGYMATPGERPVFRAKCITHRNGAIYQNFISQKPPSESMMIQGIALEALIYKHLARDMGYPLRDVNAIQNSGLTTVAISFKNSYPGQAKQIISVALSVHPAYVKTVIAVDDDIDIRNPLEMDWAIAFRVQADRDIFTISKAPSFPLDPSIGPPDLPIAQKILGAKMGIDATRKWDYPDISLPPKELMDRVHENWNNYGLPSPDMSI